MAEKKRNTALEKEMAALFSEHPGILFGFTDASFSPYGEEYASALAFAVPYGERLTQDFYSEERFDLAIKSAKERLEDIAGGIERILKRHGTRYWIPPAAQKDEKELLAPVSFKTAAARAGIGWFGKNDVIITEKYGPHVRLSAILIDEVFEYAVPITESRCPEACTRCVDACPCGALKNRLWTRDTDREEIIDYQRCNRMRSASIPRLGRKNACGLCMAACPVGLEESALPDT